MIRAAKITLLEFFAVLLSRFQLDRIMV